MAVPHALLHILSLLYLATVISLVLGLNEQGTWEGIRREWQRRWLKLVGVLGGIAAATMALTLASSWLST